MKLDEDSAQVRVPPPLLLLLSILIGVGLQFIYPVHLIRPIIRFVLGASMIGMGLGVILYCARLFKKTETAIEPWKKTSHIIASGPYKWSRNPIYLSFVVIGLGFAFALDNLWIAVMQVPLVAIITVVVIRKEERYLQQKFGISYQAYKSEVRRWV